MEAIKISKNVTFDVKFADGTTKPVETGILIEIEPDGVHLQSHMGTSDAKHVFAAIEALEEMVEAAGLLELFKAYRKL